MTWTLSNSDRTLTGSVGGTPVMTISIVSATANGGGQVTYAYTATLLEPLTHPLNDNEDAVVIDDVGYTVTDSDNDPFTGSFDVTIVDDVPEAIDDGVTQGSENAAVVIDVFANDATGADGVDPGTGVAVVAAA